MTKTSCTPDGSIGGSSMLKEFYEDIFDEPNIGEWGKHIYVPGQPYSIEKLKTFFWVSYSVYFDVLIGSTTRRIALFLCRTSSKLVPTV